MSSTSSAAVYWCLPWLCFLVIISVNTPPCQGVQYLCGKKLSDALDLICQAGFGTKTKKSLDPIDYYSEIEDDTPLAIEGLPFMSDISSNALTKTRRRRHGVYDECCRKPCTMYELRSYCL